LKRLAKIACTLGPSCDDEGTFERLLEAGTDLARLNFSHGTPAEHARRVRRLRRVSRRLDRPVGLLADLQGPRLRVGKLPGGEAELPTGKSVELVAGRERDDAGRIPVSYAALARDVRRKEAVLLDDGNLELRVRRVHGRVVTCDVVRGGILRDHKGINLPDSHLSTRGLTKKDRADLELAVELGADWLAVSFVRSAADIATARRLLARAGSAMPVMAKIERREALDELEAIIAAADGLMVARGDLGVELPTERVPSLQRRIVEAANHAGKPVVTATQMLDSMRTSPRPTRAEASDVANAVLDGSGCLLLTAETAVGDYPVEAVATMHRIIVEAESEGIARFAPPKRKLDVAEAVALAASRAAKELAARYLIAFTRTGATARAVARFRPSTPILALTPLEETRRQLSPIWGVETYRLREYKRTSAMMQALDRELPARKLAKRGDVVVVLLGTGAPGSTNRMHVHRIGDSA
jgi:pyruvate kinase